MNEPAPATLAEDPLGQLESATADVMARMRAVFASQAAASNAALVEAMRTRARLRRGGHFGRLLSRLPMIAMPGAAPPEAASPAASADNASAGTSVTPVLDRAEQIEQAAAEARDAVERSIRGMASLP